jgi:hypothetical protein
MDLICAWGNLFAPKFLFEDVRAFGALAYKVGFILHHSVTALFTDKPLVAQEVTA